MSSSITSKGLNFEQLSLKSNEYKHISEASPTSVDMLQVWQGLSTKKKSNFQIHRTNSDHFYMQRGKALLQESGNYTHDFDDHFFVQEGITLVQEPGRFTYEGFASDLKDVFKNYMLGNDEVVKSILTRIYMKQEIYDGTVDVSGFTSSGMKDSEMSLEALVINTMSNAKEVQVEKETTSPSTRTPESNAAKFMSSPREKKVTFAETLEEEIVTKESNVPIHTIDVERWVPDSCMICQSAPRTHIYNPCGHLVSCNACAFKSLDCKVKRKSLVRKQKKRAQYYCPQCNVVADSMKKIYY